MKTKKNDFVEIDFTANIKNSKIFDTTVREEALKTGLITKEEKREFKPLIACIGQGMVVNGFDKELEDKEINKDYEVELEPKDAFGMRKPNLVRPVPLSVFKERPVPGMFVDVNGSVAKIVNVTGGRVLIDLNSPLAGQVVIYKFKINKIISGKDKKIDILAKTFGFKLDDIKIENNKATAKFGKEMQIPSEILAKVVSELKKKVKEITDLELDIKS